MSLNADEDLIANMETYTKQTNMKAIHITDQDLTSELTAHSPACSFSGLVL